MIESLDDSMLHHYIMQNHHYALKDHQDWMTIVSGPEGAGKSTMAARVTLWYDPEFDIKTQAIYDAESLLNFYDLYEDVPGKVCWLDEAIAILMGEENNTEEAKAFKKVFVTHRDSEKRYVLCVPSPWLIGPYYRQWRARDFILVYIDQASLTFDRRCAYYSRGAYVPFIISPQAKNQIALPQRFVQRFKPTLDLEFPKFKPNTFTNFFAQVRLQKKEFQRSLRKDLKELLAHKREEANQTPRITDDEIIEEIRANLPGYIREFRGCKSLNGGLIAAEYKIGGRRIDRIKQALAEEVESC